MEQALGAFRSSDSKRLYKLANKLFEDGFFNCYLTPQQFNLLDLILHKYKNNDTKYKVWDAFINSTLSLRFNDNSQDQAPTTAGSTQVAASSHTNSITNGDQPAQPASTTSSSTSSSTTIPSSSTAGPETELYLKQGFKSSRNLCSTTRYLLYEKAIDYYYIYDEQEKESKFEVFSLLANDSEDEEIPIDEYEQGPNGTQQPKERSDTVRDEEDDYDDDNDGGDEEHEMKDANSPDGKHQQTEEDKMNAGIIDDTISTGPNGELVLDIDINSMISKPNFPTPPEPVSSTDDAIGKMVHPILGTASAIESNLEKQNELKLIKSFNKVYHNFENDLPNIVKRRRLERSDKQLEMVEAQNTSNDSESQENNDGDSETVNKLMNLGGAANLSLKNLLGKIEESRDKLNLSDLELKNLIMDVRKNRSKWASYHKIGQEELYEACEKVVLELRGYTEHSTAFLNRVSKREAPNYYQIIKKPMDLNTVMKKLKNFQYTSKTEFVDDLMLIWKNCLTYNSDPSHFIRADAFAMQKKTQTLIPLIPDIVIRDRSDVEREAALTSQQQDKEDDTKGATSTRGVSSLASTKKSKKSRKGAHDNPQVIDASEITAASPKEGVDETPAPNSEEAPATESAEVRTELTDDAETEIADSKDIKTEKEEEPESTSEEENKTNSKAEETLEKQKEKEEENGKLENKEEENGNKNETENGYAAVDYDEQEDEDLTNGIEESNQQTNERDDDEDDEDLEMATWKNLTSNTRYKLCEQRSSLFKDDSIQANEEALFRDTAQMSNFNSYLDDDSNVVLHKNRQYFDEKDDPYLFEYDVSGGIPSIKYAGFDHELTENKILEDMMKQGKNLESLPTPKFSVSKAGSNSILYDNITLMQDIRSVCFKINIIRQMQASQFMHQSQFQTPDIERINNKEIDPLSRLGTRDYMTPQVAFSTLKRSVSTIFMANGFEATNPFCATIVTQLAEQHIGNLARSIKLNMESASINKLPIKKEKPLGFKEILLMSLNENGIEKPDVLYSFYKEHLNKQHRKLKDLKFKLESFLRDLLRPGIQEISEQQFSDDSEQFMNGDFSNEIGEDFFGFRELGLDKEFGLLTSTIPLHLLHSKLSNQFSQLDSKSKKAKYEDFDEIKFPKLTKRDLPSQIGLLKPFYDELLLKSKTMYSKQLKKHQTMVLAAATTPADGEVPPPTPPAITANGVPIAPPPIAGVKPPVEHVASADPPDMFVEIKDPEDLVIIEDDDLPQKQRNNRPKIPPNGKITQVKKKFIANSFFLDAQDKREEDERLKHEAEMAAELAKQKQKELEMDEEWKKKEAESVSGESKKAINSISDSGSESGSDESDSDAETKTPKLGAEKDFSAEDADKMDVDEEDGDKGEIALVDKEGDIEIVDDAIKEDEKNEEKEEKEDKEEKEEKQDKEKDEENGPSSESESDEDEKND